jgi:predicted transcriptional regulator
VTDLDLKKLDPAVMRGACRRGEGVLRSLASRHRLMILCRLVEGEASVGELVRALGLGQSNLSRHLAMLREEGLVATRREGVVILARIPALGLVVSSYPLHTSWTCWPEQACWTLAGQRS